MSYDWNSFDKSIVSITEHLASEFSNLRTGRASMSLLDSVRVDSYGSPTPLNQVGSISVEDARTIKVAPWDSSLVGAIDKAITASNLGVTSSVSEGVVRVHFPELTGETRERIAKVAKEKHEDARIALRNERNKAMGALDAMKKDVGEDEHAALKDKLEKKVADANKKFDEMLESKQTELRG